MNNQNNFNRNLIKKSSHFLKQFNLQKIKDTIKKSFNEKDVFKSVLFLDYIYSTNLSKNKYSFEDIVEYINSSEFEKISKNIGENILVEISKLKFGLSKNKAISFFSKYFFYLNNFDFPIYDSLVIKSSKTIFIAKP